MVDEITLPIRSVQHLVASGATISFNGDAALVNLSGDVWIEWPDVAREGEVETIATGLFQPLGCKVVDGKVS